MKRWWNDCRTIYRPIPLDIFINRRLFSSWSEKEFIWIKIKRKIIIFSAVTFYSSDLATISWHIQLPHQSSAIYSAVAETFHSTPPHISQIRQDMILWTIFPLIFYELNSVSAEVMAPICLPHHIHFINSYPFRFKAHFIFPFSFWLGIRVYSEWEWGERKRNQFVKICIPSHPLLSFTLSGKSTTPYRSRKRNRRKNNIAKLQTIWTFTHPLLIPFAFHFNAIQRNQSFPVFPTPLLLIYKII